ncbi:hypothetical protein BJ165DRAFT_226983 [Panaeolus papilionaceus]|nr:hypothetical protein BJ165DRAFT_226983 [Panaeolus papilionaceus]
MKRISTVKTDITEWQLLSSHYPSQRFPSPSTTPNISSLSLASPVYGRTGAPRLDRPPTFCSPYASIPRNNFTKSHPIQSRSSVPKKTRNTDPPRPPDSPAFATTHITQVSCLPHAHTSASSTHSISLFHLVSFSSPPLHPNRSLPHSITLSTHPSSCHDNSTCARHNLTFNPPPFSSPTRTSTAESRIVPS